jgi:hypothetical protein
MAWNPSPQMADIRDLARKWAAKQLIVIEVRYGGAYAVHSFGQTKELCDHAKPIGDKVFGLIEDGTVKVN